MAKLVTPKQVAQAIGVSESSLKRWCDRGKLASVRTAGGHRRLSLDAVIEFLRQSGHAIDRPELLGLPSNTGRGAVVIDRARDAIRDALVAGDEETCRRLVFDLHLAGQPIHAICDHAIAPAFRDIGELWDCGSVEVYQERRATELCLHALAEVRSVMAPAPPGAPLAIGGTPECDPYSLPTAMAELVLRQAGWAAQSLGSRLPFATLLAAIKDAKPRIFWLSVSHVDDETQFVEQYRAFFEQVPPQVAVIVGGRALTEPLRRRMSYGAYGDMLEHLQAFARTLARTLAAGARPRTHGAAQDTSAAPES